MKRMTKERKNEIDVMRGMTDSDSTIKKNRMRSDLLALKSLYSDSLIQTIQFESISRIENELQTDKKKHKKK